MGEIVDESGSRDDFIGHPGGNNFIIITTEEGSPKIHQGLKERFSEQVLSHYNFIDREQGFILTNKDDGSQVQTPLMSVSIGTVSPAHQTISDIREITELASEARRRDLTGKKPDNKTVDSW